MPAFNIPSSVSAVRDVAAGWAAGAPQEPARREPSNSFVALSGAASGQSCCQSMNLSVSSRLCSFARKFGNNGPAASR
jgi:hypothetical protein